MDGTYYLYRSMLGKLIAEHFFVSIFIQASNNQNMSRTWGQTILQLEQGDIIKQNLKAEYVSYLPLKFFYQLMLD